MIELEERHAGRVLLSWLRSALDGQKRPAPLVLIGSNAREIILGAVLQLIADDVDALVAPASWLELGELPEDPPKVLAVLIDLDTPDDLDDIRARAQGRLDGLQPQLAFSAALRDAMPDDTITR